MNPTLLIFGSIFTFSVFSSSLLFLITKERFQMIVFLIASTGAFFLNQLFIVTTIGQYQTPFLAYFLVGLTIIAIGFRFMTNRYQLLPKSFLIISIFVSLIGVFFL